MNLIFFIFVVITIFLEICAQYLFKISYKKPNLDSSINKYVPTFLNGILKNNKNLVILLGVILYALTGFFVYKLLAFSHLGTINIILHLMNFIILFLIGYFLFEEKLTNLKIFAIILCLLSIIIFMIDGYN